VEEAGEQNYPKAVLFQGHVDEFINADMQHLLVYRFFLIENQALRVIPEHNADRLHSIHAVL
jgi:hypothetical protein